MLRALYGNMRTMVVWRGLAVVGLAWATGSESQPAIPKTNAYRVEEERLGAFHERDDARRLVVWSPKFSEDGCHVAYEVHEGDRRFVVVDGQPGPAYRYIKEIVFSPDGKRVAYAAETGLGKWVLIVDGRPATEECEDVDLGYTFSVDGRRLAYPARKGSKRFVVVDGQSGPGYDYVWGIVFSRDAQRVAYGAQKDGKNFVVVDGQPSPGYEDIVLPFLSPDGKRIAYWGRKGRQRVILKDDKWLVVPADEGDGVRVVVDGQEGPPYDAVRHIVFSPDSKRLAYSAEKSGQWFLVVDGQRGSPFEAIPWTCIAFSPDSKRIAYAAKTGDKWLTVLDGQPGPQYDHIMDFVFAQDGKRYAYAGKKGDQWFAVIDAQPGPGYSEVRSPTFSPDGKHSAYAAARGKVQRIGFHGTGTGVYAGEGTRMFMVFDGREGPEYGLVERPMFSPDGKHFVFKASKGRKWFVVLDDAPCPEYDAILDKGPCFRSNGVLEYLAVKQKSLYRVKHLPVSEGK
ncbi:MAG: hypothetical protein FJ279_02850 [Planctomycetes bacterium]|nr:hypothetical protein [Planctomycetota bacterium]